jgi:hypothetical protein
VSASGVDRRWAIGLPLAFAAAAAAGSQFVHSTAARFGVIAGAAALVTAGAAFLYARLHRS